MKILLITHLVPYPPKRGVMIRNFNLLKQIARDHQVDMLTFNQAPHFGTPEELQQSIEVLRPLCRRLEVFRIPTDSSKLRWYLMLLLNVFSPVPYSIWRFSSRKMEAAIRERLKSESYDVMEIGTIALARYARLAPDLPKILVHHNIESQLLYRRSQAMSNWFSKIYLRYQAWKLRRFEREFGELFDRHTVCSEQDQDSLKAICPEAQVVVVPNGVDTEFFRPSGALIKPDTLVHAGGTNWFPNRDGLLYFMKEIWPIVKQKVPHLEFVGIGKQVDPELAAFSEKDRTFRQVGFVDDIRTYVAEAAVYVVPLRVGGGTRLKILEAMAMGKAIVSTSIGAEGIKCVHGQDIMLADTPQDFADRIVELLDDEAKRGELGKNARNRAVSTYSWKLIAPILERTYQDAVKGRKRD
jgi:sugar transferase (PEP-CTERM/EpsH1 system associated)